LPPTCHFEGGTTEKSPAKEVGTSTYIVILNGPAQALRAASEESHELALSFIAFRSFIRAVTLPTQHSG